MKRHVLIILLFVTIAIVLAVTLGVYYGTKPNNKTSIPEPTTPSGSPEPSETEYRRIDCYPEEKWAHVDVTKAACESRGCVYDPFETSTGVYIPSCYVDSTQGYVASGRQNTGLGDKYVLTPTGLNGKDTETRIARVGFEVFYPNENIVRFKFYDDDNPRYEVPPDVVPIDLPQVDVRNFTTELKYRVEVTEDPFSFRIVRAATGTVLFDSSVGGLDLQDQLLTISTRLPSHNVYGFGENSHESFRHDMNFRTWGMFARDQWVGTGVHNHYSVHPFYTCLEEDGNSHGLFLLNSNAMDYTLSPLPMLTMRTVGGILDLYMFVGPTPENVVQQYTGVIGRPYMPPYWSLGFQLCRYGYNSLTKLQEAVNRTLEAEIPLDVQYADIDHYDVRKVFTIDNVAFAGLPEYFEYLRENGMHTIIILDPCLISNETIGNETSYEPFNRGLDARAFIEWPSADVTDKASYIDDTQLAILGFVWPQGKVVFPDFLKPQTEDLWHDLIVEHFDRIKFDGLWIDMNEPANFGTNEERPWNWPEDAKPYWSLQCPEDPLEDPPYRTMAVYTYDAPDRKSRLSEKTLCMVSRQGVNRTYSHYDVHNLYGTSQIRSTLKGLRSAHNDTARGLVVGRSTFPGSGKMSGHWLGDNFSTWKALKESIIGMLEFNLFGFPYIGADICGFFSETSTELCKRWMQLGAFYPYSRNHNQADNKIDQDPANFNTEVTKLSRDALRIRYTLLPYLYTLFYEAHSKGSTVVRPLFHEFPNDVNTWGIDEQFLWGPALMIAPILTEESSMSYYLPRATWFDHYTSFPQQWDNEDGKWHSLDVQSDSQIPLYYRGGYIIPTQGYANNTRYSRQNDFELRVFLDKGDDMGGKASGQLFWDDGDSIDTIEREIYYLARYTYSSRTLTIDVQHNNGPDMSGFKLDKVSIVGVYSKPFVMTVNGEQHLDFSLQQPKLDIINLNLAMDQNAEITISYDAPLPPDIADRIDCQPDSSEGDMDVCLARGCLWGPTQVGPRCYMNSSNSGYSLTAENNGTLELTKIGPSSMFGGDLMAIKVMIEDIKTNVLRIKIFNDNRFEVPVNIDGSGPQGSSDYSVEYPKSTTAGEPFYIKVKRDSTGTYIWDTSIGGLVFADQFLQLATRVPSKNLYGFGENRHFSYRHDFSYKTWPMFSRDQAPGWGDYGNLYGVHPYYMCLEDEEGHSHGVLLLNSNAMEVSLSPAPAITYRTVGGILDFYIMLGDTPEDVTRTYTGLIGRPYLPPYWALGFQLCRYGYENIENMKAAVDRTIAAKIPYDVQYGDIDHFVDNKIFTWDQERFPGLPDYFKELQRKGMKIIIILDPFILATDPTYEVYTKAGDIFIKWPTDVEHPDKAKFNSSNMYGYVWPPGPAVFPDFMKPECQTWWENCIKQYYWNNMTFDGLWIDMNEPANFGTNDEKPWNWPEDSTEEPWSLKCPTSQLDDPPYKPRSVFGARLSEKTLCMVGQQQDGNGGVTDHYNMHSLYGLSHTIPTLKALQFVTVSRGMVISRSTYPSSGTMTGHWLGDNDSSWAHMRESIIGSLEFNLFGIPYIGADICGYFGDVQPQLCQRWMQLGAFYTYSRNHNGRGYTEQDPAVFGQAIAESSRKALEVRYTLLPYLYTLFQQAHVHGSSVLRPLLHEFYSDFKTYDIDRQFLWGSSLLITPVLEENAVTVDAYFPNARWFDYYTGKEITPGYHTLDAPLDHIPVHVRGASILPTQRPANNTKHSRENPVGLIVAANEHGMAAGNLFWDNGTARDVMERNNFHLFEYSLKNNVLSMTILNKTDEVTLPKLDTIRMFGIESIAKTVMLEQDGKQTDLTDKQLYNPTTKELQLQWIDIMQGSLNSSWMLTFSYA